MTTLAQMQRNFIHDCLSGELKQGSVLMAENIESHDISAHGLMKIYQNSALANITQSLSLTYPVIEALVGQDFFRAMCRRYIQTSWPSSGNMDDYGADFPVFLAEFEHAKHLTYLKDVASLEWAFHLSSLADDKHFTDWSTLSQVSNILQLQFTLAPSFRLINSTYPIDKIWQLNQVDNTADINLDMNVNEDTVISWLVVYRRELKTVILPVTSGEYVLLAAFEQGAAFEEAITDASQEQADLSIDDALKKFIELGIISGFVDKVLPNDQ
jgi:hypothetical protein